MRARHETSRSTVRKMKNVSDYKHTHTQTQTTYAHQTRFRSAKKRNQHAEMGTGHIFSHKLPKEKKKNEKRKTREKQEHRHERGKMVDALVVDATLASTFKMIKRGGGKKEKKKNSRKKKENLPAL